jgi:hypothetical protein
MNGLTIQYGWHLCNLQFLKYHEVSVFLVDILRQFQPDSLTSVVSGGQFVRYALAGDAQEKIDQKWPVKLQTTQTLNNVQPTFFMV